MPEDKINGLKCVSWTYTVHAEDRFGNSMDLRHVGRFDTPTKASSYIRENCGAWAFFRSLYKSLKTELELRIFG